MENKEQIYLLARLLDLEFMVWKKGVFIGRYKFINGKIEKL